MFSYFCTVSNIPKSINAELKGLLKIPLVSSQLGNIKQVSNILFKSLLKSAVNSSGHTYTLLCYKTSDL